MSNKTDLQALNASYAALIEELQGKAVGGGSGGGSNIEIAGTTVTFQSSAEGSVICAYETSAGIVSESVTMTYFSQTRKYRCLIEGVLLNTPITVISSGSITNPAAIGYTVEALASGTGYKVFKITESSGGDTGGGEIPAPPG